MTIPHDPSDLSHEVWGFVLDKKAEAGCVWIVIDELLVQNRNPQFAPNSVVSIRKTQVRHKIPRDPEAPVLLLTLQDGDIIEVRRVDGKTAPLKIRIDEGDGAALYRVDHTGRERLLLPE